MHCFNPLRIRNPHDSALRYYDVPCGKCLACRKNKVNDWTIRIMEDVKSSRLYSYFVTLTYSDEFLPFDLDSGLPVVDKPEVQKFIKRLRHCCSEKFRYFLVSEYGENYCRPHYHAIFINVDLDEKRFRKTLEDCWNFGFCHIGSVTYGSVHYCVGYIFKTNDNDAFGTPVEPFRLMSKGLGSSYVARMKTWHSGLPERCYYPDHSFKKKLPIYLKNKLYETEIDRANLYVYNKQLSRQRGYSWLQLSVEPGSDGCSDEYKVLDSRPTIEYRDNSKHKYQRNKSDF